jgi:hypothetical protein
MAAANFKKEFHEKYPFSIGEGSLVATRNFIRTDIMEHNRNTVCNIPLGLFEFI